MKSALVILLILATETVLYSSASPAKSSISGNRSLSKSIRNALRLVSNRRGTRNPHGFTDLPADYVKFREVPKDRVMSHVLFMHNTKNGMKCVLKSDRNAENEIDVLRTLNSGGNTSPFVEQLYHTFKVNEKTFAVLEFVEGSDIYDFQKDHNRPMTVEEIRRYTAQLVLALKYVHDRGIIFDDTKTDNVMISDEGRIVLIDFGLSCFRGSKKTLHRRWQFANTFVSSPEMIFADNVGHRWHEQYTIANNGAEVGYNHMTDFYGLGLIVHYMYCQKYTYFTRSMEHLVLRFMIYRERPPVPTETCDRLKTDKAAYDFVLRLIDFDTKLRLGVKGYKEIQEHDFFPQGKDPAFWSRVENEGRAAQARDHEKATLAAAEWLKKAAESKNSRPSSRRGSVRRSTSTKGRSGGGSSTRRTSTKRSSQQKHNSPKRP